MGDAKVSQRGWPRGDRIGRVGRCGMVGAVLFSLASAVGGSGASAAPTACASAPSFGVGVAIVPEFVGADEVAVTAYVGEVIDYDVTVFLRQDPPGTPNGVVVCPIFDGALTIVLPDGSGPFTIATGISLPVGGSVTFEDVPSQKYTMNASDVVTAPGCAPDAPCYDRVQATAQVEATSEGPDDGPEDNAPVQATATAPTFLLAPSTQLTLTPSSLTINAGQSIQWTVTETNDTPARYFPMPLSDAHVDLSTDGGVSAFARLDATSANFSGDANGDAQLDVGETWTWVFTTAPVANTTLTATGFGTGTRAHIVTFPADAEERSASDVVVTPTTTTPTTTTPTTTTPTTTTPTTTTPTTTSPASVLLPATGASSPSVPVALAGATTLIGGLVLIAISRRRQVR
jgi:LPXTG-motif cell wall-anchored protein